MHGSAPHGRHAREPGSWLRRDGLPDRRPPYRLAGPAWWFIHGRRREAIPSFNRGAPRKLDIGYEWYGGKASYFSVHGFYMWLDNYIYTQVIPVDFTGVHRRQKICKAQDSCNGCTISPIGIVDAPANGKGGWIRGVEVSGAFEFGRVSRILDGFGATGSVSYTDYKLTGGRQRHGIRAPRFLQMGLRRDRIL